MPSLPAEGFMTDAVSARAVQTLLGAVYALLALIALARSGTIVMAALAIAMLLGAYITSRTIPDFQVRRDQILQVCGLGLVVIMGGTIVDMTGSPHALEWASVVMPYCAGNRLRAAGIGPAIRW
jgi:hypothetical protein